MLTCPLIATYGCSARVTISGAADAVQLGELNRLVEAIPAGRIDAGEPEQPDRVVMPEHPDRDAAVPCELPDAEHDVFRFTASHGVRVKLSRRGCRPAGR
jgi:hypothetical protein